MRIERCGIEILQWKVQWKVPTGKDYVGDEEASALSSELFRQSDITEMPILVLLMLLSSYIAFAFILGLSLVNLLTYLALKLLASCTHTFLHNVFSHFLYDSSSQPSKRGQPLARHYAPLQPVHATPLTRSFWTRDTRNMSFQELPGS